MTITGGSGLHARPATFLVDVAKGFQADVRLRAGERVANGKSLASLLGLGVEAGSTVTVLASGTDADAALAAIREAVASGLGEDDEDAHASAPLPTAAVPAWQPLDDATAVPGIAASPGIAIGPIWHLKRQRLVVERTAKDPAAQDHKLRQALQGARAELRTLHDEVAARSGPGKAAIFRAHEAFLDDPASRRGHSQAGRACPPGGRAGGLRPRCRAVPVETAAAAGPPPGRRRRRVMRFVAEPTGRAALPDLGRARRAA